MAVLMVHTDKNLKFSGKKEVRFTGYTLKTANSAGSGPVFIRISGFGSNPVKYTDPDGRTGENAYKRGYALKIEGTKQIAQGNTLLNIGTHPLAYLLSNNAEIVSQGEKLIASGEINIAKGNLLIEIVKTGAISKIAHHSYKEEHARKLGLQTEADIVEKIDSILSDPNTQMGIEIDRKTNEYVYGFLASDGSLLIYNPGSEKNNGTIFMPSDKDYFDRNFSYDFEDVPK
jgi:hypothetical protein